MKYLQVVETARWVLFWLNADECHGLIPRYP
jgi:hypothetical protein